MISFFSRLPWRRPTLIVDIGSAVTKIGWGDDERIWQIPSFVALRTQTHSVVGVGDAARTMYGSLAAHVTTHQVAVRGKIVDVRLTAAFFRACLQNIVHIHPVYSFFPFWIHVVCIVPDDVTPVQRRAYLQVFREVGMWSVVCVPSLSVIPQISARGTHRQCVLEIAAGHSMIGILDGNQVIRVQRMHLGVQDIIHILRREIRGRYHCDVGEMSITQLLEQSGACRADTKMTLRGKGIEHTIPQSLTVVGEDVIVACTAWSAQQLTQIERFFSSLDPDTVAQLYQHGIVCVGGGAMITHLRTALSKQLGIHVYLHPEASTAAIVGWRQQNVGGRTK